MITDYPADFISAFSATSRKPIQLAEFYLPGGTYHLSDCPVGISDGLAHDFQPWVESWGTLQDNTQLKDILEGSSLGIRSCQITLIMSPTSADFIKAFYSAGVENTTVKLYQWFMGVTSGPQLIDVFVCQDPISISESSILMRVDLVTPLLANNPPLWPPAVGTLPRPIVIGKGIGLPLIDLQTARKTGLAQDMTYNAVGEFFVDNGVGFPASGQVSIDSEVCTYTWISASAINITARAQAGTTARPHYRGALVVPYGAVYDYAICAGPVTTVDNFLGNGEAYINPVTILAGQNPVIARFVGRPPWLRVEPGADGDDIIPDPVTGTEYGAEAPWEYSGVVGTVLSPTNVNAAAGAATMRTTRNLSGGAGSVNLATTSVTYTNCAGPTNTTKVQSLTDGAMKTMCHPTFGDIINGEIGVADLKITTLHTTYGDPTAVKVTVTFGILSELIQSSVKVRVIHYKHDGTKTTLQEWVVDGLTRTWGDAYRPPWYNTSFQYTLPGITTFAQLRDTRVRIELENVTSKTYVQYTTSQERAFVDVDSVVYNVDYYIPAGSTPDGMLDLVSYFNRNLTSYGALTNVTVKVKAAFTLTNAVADLKMVRRSTTNPADNVVLWSQMGATSSIAATERTFNLGSMSWSSLQSLRVGCNYLLTGVDTPGTTQQVECSFEYVQWVLTYQPGAIPTPDEERVVYAETMTCDVTSLFGANPTPASCIRTLIEEQSTSGPYIDDTDFDAAHAAYVAESYYMNGVLPADTKLHDALRQVLSEGICQLLFNRGKIQLLTLFDQESTTIDIAIPESDVLLRSRRIENQPTSMVRNKWTVRYNRSYAEDVYDAEKVVEDSASIAKFGLVEYVKDLLLVRSLATATRYANYYLALSATPPSIHSVVVFLPTMRVEKGDIVTFRSMLDPTQTITGRVLSTSRIFGAGKLGKINTISLQVVKLEV